MPGDVGLSGRGRLQAEHTAAWLADRGVRSILCSPLLRARETAAVIGEATGAGVDVDPRLRERMNWGDIEGQSFAEFAVLWDATAQDRDRSPLGGAPSARTAGELLEEVLCEADDGPVVVVAHGGLLQCLHENLAERAGRVPAERLSIPHCSITEFAVMGGDVSLRSIGALPENLSA